MNTACTNETIEVTKFLKKHKVTWSSKTKNIIQLYCVLSSPWFSKLIDSTKITWSAHSEFYSQHRLYKHVLKNPSEFLKLDGSRVQENSFLHLTKETVWAGHYITSWSLRGPVTHDLWEVSLTDRRWKVPVTSDWECRMNTLRL